MKDIEATNIAVVRKYVDGCSTGHLEDLPSTFAPDVCHYFLPPSFPPITAAEHLARYWRKYRHALDPLWSIDRIIAIGDEFVNEWSCVDPSGKQAPAHGARHRVVSLAEQPDRRSPSELHR
jgi:SnoaL-like domain